MMLSEVTSHLGDKPSGRQPTGRHILVNWATEVETTGPQLWKCERLTIAVLEELCAVLGQRPFNITRDARRTVHLNMLRSCGFNRRIAVFRCVGGFSAILSDFLPTIIVDTLITTLCRRPSITACYGEVVLDSGIW